MGELPAWIEGQGLAAAPEPDGALGCHTTARVEAGVARFEAHHVERLQRDAQALGFRTPPAEGILAAFRELGGAAFGKAAGIVRIDLQAHPPKLVARARALRPERVTWRALSFGEPHPGPGRFAGVKLSAEPVLDAARARLAKTDADEILLADRAGFWVEGARSALLFENASGQQSTPHPKRGGVRSIALAVLGEHLPDLRFGDLPTASIFDARAVVALNAVRGARALTSLDGKPLGSGGPGLAERLNEILSSS